MKKIFFVFTIIILFSCKKYVTEPEELRGVSKSTHGKYEQPCRIDYMLMENDTLYFSYTPWGDPDKIEDPEQRSPSYYFTYDKSKRLVELQGAWIKDVNINQIVRFYYHGNRVISDSVYYYNGVAERKYVYDKYDRVIEYNYISTSLDPLSSGEVTKDTIKYTYPDENPYVGNRNYLAGNRLLMFLHRYYEKTTSAESYNTFGYPTHFVRFLERPFLCCFDITETVYDCSESKKTQHPTQ